MTWFFVEKWITINVHVMPTLLPPILCSFYLFCICYKRRLTFLSLFCLNILSYKSKFDCCMTNRVVLVICFNHMLIINTVYHLLGILQFHTWDYCSCTRTSVVFSYNIWLQLRIIDNVLCSGVKYLKLHKLAFCKILLQ